MLRLSVIVGFVMVCANAVQASGSKMEDYLMSCNTSAYGCCPDGETPAHGLNFQGCCLQHEFGCCPDNYRLAEGPNNEGCGCEYARFGCCTDNITIARGPHMKGCGCEHSRYGCCPDRHTKAQGLEFMGCECHTYQFGCCPDGVTIASGPELQGCRCERSKYGCCGDETTSAKGPNMEGCDCSNSKYGCCPDGETEAKGDKFLNCSSVPVNKQAACVLNHTQGTCSNYTALWFYDMEYGGCSQFWYGGCGGNANRFVSREECEDVCVRPSPKDTCNLPKVKASCDGYNVRWYYNSEQEQCSQFIYGGCLGNANNFDSKEICEEHCEPENTEDFNSRSTFIDQCNLALERGPCAGHFVRWGFSAERRRCEQFTWGGCGGNHNRYDSEAACQLQCTPPGQPRQECSLPQDPGNCTEKHPVWSFNNTDNRCVPFYYSGCGGNDNRFNSEHSCDYSCPRAYVQEICTLPAVIGDCADYTIKWFFDTTKKRCRQFFYGGCGGNENNFLSESECEIRCSGQPTTTIKPELLQPQSEPAEHLPRSVRVKTHILSEDTLVVVGSELTLVCDVEGYPLPEVSWYKGYAQIFSDDRITIAENRLTVSRVNKNDTGLYRCYAVNDLSSHQSSVLIIVEDPRWLSKSEDGNTSITNEEDSTTETTASDLFSTTTYFTTTDRLDTSTTEVRVKTHILSEDTLVVVGSELTLVCDVEGYPLPEVSWYKGYAQIFSDDRITIAENRLTVSRVNKNDTGLYRCYAVNDLSSHQSSVLIIVEDPRWLSKSEDGNTSITNEEDSTTETTASDLFSTTTYFTTTDRLDTSTIEVRVKTHILSEDTLVVVGSELSLVCEVEGYPLPEVSWYKGYAQIFSDDRITIAENRLTVSRVNKNDTGLYRCYAVNDLSSHQSSVLIIVEDPRWLSKSEDGNTSITYEEDSTTETTASDLFSTTTYFTTTDRLDTSTTEVRVKTHILSEDTLVVVGSELSLVCEVEGYPLPEVSWYKGYAQIFSDDRITIAENRLTVSRVNKNDTGLYRCYAVNDLSSHQSSVLIIVEDPRWLSKSEDGNTSITYEEDSTTETTASDLFSTTTYFTTTDRLDTSTTEVRVKTHILSEDTLVVVGSELSLVCEVEGYPLPEVSWYKGYAQIFSDDRITIAENRLTVSRVNKNDTGLYRCYAVNDLSSHQSSALIIVEDPRWLSKSEDGNTSITYEEDSTTETTASDLFSTTTYFTTTDRLDTSTTEESDESGTTRSTKNSEIREISNAPVRVKTHIVSKDTWLAAGSELTLVCEVDGYPIPAVFWYKDYAEMSSNDRITIAENRLTVSRVNKNDTGLYRCYAVNDVNSPHSSVLIIVEDSDESGTRSTKTPEIREILMSPVPVVAHKAGIQLTLVCEVNGYPVPAVSWYKDHAEISSDDRITMAETRLTVSRLNNNDTGLYECYAANDFNSHYSSVQIIVEGLYIPPTCKDNPYFKCNLIVRSKVCSHKFYSKFCCKSCVEAGQLGVRDLQLQADDTLYRK